MVHLLVAQTQILEFSRITQYQLHKFHYKKFKYMVPNFLIIPLGYVTSIVKSRDV